MMCTSLLRLVIPKRLSSPSPLLVAPVLRRHVSTQHYDVVIVGGGVVGSACAKLLEERCGPSMSIALLEQSPAAAPNSSSRSIIPHPRSYALSPKSMELLNVVNGIPDKLGHYKSMQIWEQQSPGMLVFTADDLPNHHDCSLGACVEDAVLVEFLHSSLQSTVLYREEMLQSLQQDTSSSTTTIQTNNRCLTTSLVIAADGGNSWVRQRLGIPWLGWDYGRTALTCTVELQQPMPLRAFQRFLPNGPMALLPTYSPHHAVVVWSTTPELAKKYQECDNTDLLVDLVNSTLQVGPQRPEPLFESTTLSSSLLVQNVLYGMERLVDTVHYGLAMRHWTDYHDTGFMAPPKVATVISPRMTFPLSCRHVSSYIGSSTSTINKDINNNNNIRFALVGDAAHMVHPMAGQGLNLGLEDVDVLSRTIEKAHGSGMELSTFLSEYNSQRKQVVQMKLAGMHLLHQVFAAESTVWKHAKSVGMQVVNQVTPIRTKLASVAAGL